MHCENKKPYSSAQEAANAAMGRTRSGVQYLRVYSCPDCGAFHLTGEKPNAANVLGDKRKGKRRRKKSKKTGTLAFRDTMPKDEDDTKEFRNPQKSKRSPRDLERRGEDSYDLG